MQAQNRLKEEVESLDTAATEVGQNETQSRLTKLDAAFKKINDAADNIVQHFDKFGFKTEAEARKVRRPHEVGRRHDPHRRPAGRLQRSEPRRPDASGDTGRHQ
jgi:DNA anti-recombination protein RmuC